MEPHEVLKAQVDVVATLGELVATVTAPRRSVWPLLYQSSLHTDLTRFTGNLHCTLDRHSVVSLHQRGVTSLRHRHDTPRGQRGVTNQNWLLATLTATPRATWANVRAAARAWREWVDGLEHSWFWLVEEAADLLDDWEDVAKATPEATTEDTDDAAATAQAGDLQGKTASQEIAGDSLVHAIWLPPVALAEKKAALLVAGHEARVAAATKAMEEAMEEAMVAASQVVAATRRVQQAKVARGLLGRLVVMCDRASLLPLELHDRLKDIEAALAGTEEAYTDVPEALVAAVAEVELLCEASAHLTTRHLLGTLGDIQKLLSSPCGGSSGPRAVSEQCQKAIEDIPRLLGGQ
ncbi:uncharacterized protein LOC134565385 [Prinia subflava]|uniref:uncharacterized protein LOC134565385 n=1 Tax=Prinia subflava TaxID=208062 RepID=UPI002FE17437